MSTLRRARQAARVGGKPGFWRRISVNFYKHRYGAIIGLILSFAPKLLQEFAKTKFLDWIMEWFGGFGAWLAGYPFSFFIIAGILIMVFLVAVTLWESFTPEESVIVDLGARPYRIQRIPQNWAVGLTVCAIGVLGIIVYGAFDFYRSLPLLNKYPLGYVIFSGDYVSGAVTPIEVRRGLEEFQFDFRPVRVIENPKDRIEVRLPDILLGGKLMATGAATGGPKRVGDLGGVFAGDTTRGAVTEWAEILAIKGKEITFVVGFERTPPIHKAN